ncbi:hypothetical protein BJY01DRAFT_214424 [Aspergillus pseudoustus]|uniref:Uncharacterized protein n=1 Tax=Aspergillus pseudoustus TaxID=1810923 RepID=A0ABR4JYV8_9EURO
MIPPPTLRDLPFITIFAIGIYVLFCPTQLGAQTFERTGKVTRITLDVDRCIELHNAIIRENAEAPGYEPLEVANYTDYWADKEPDELRRLKKKLKAPLFEFLSRSHQVVDQNIAMTPFTWGLTWPSGLYSSPDFLFWGDYGDPVMLYRAASWEYNSAGLVFDMKTNKATWVNLHWNTPPVYQEHIWAPLDVILEEWLTYLRRRAVPRYFDEHAFGGHTEGWGLLYPPPQDVEEDLELWDRYVGLVESKLPQGPRLAISNTSTTGMHGPEFTGFPKAFFSQARRPTFKYVAPELVFPSPSQLSRLAEHQRATWVELRIMGMFMEYVTNSDTNFDAAPDAEKVLPTVLFPLGDNIHAGLSTTSQNAWQDGVGLILPTPGVYDLQYGEGLRKHGSQSFKRVWQVEPRESPFWAPHPARLARVLEKWIQYVEDGTWKVGKEGIKGTINSFLKNEVLDGYRGIEVAAYGMFLDGVDGS